MARSDDELVLAMTRGDQTALGEFYERHVKRVHVVAFAIVGNAAQASEITQEVFLEVWKTATHFDPERGSVLSWLSVVARSRALDQARRRSRRYKKEPIDDDMPSTNRVPSLDAVHLPAALSLLSDREREVIALGYFEELSSAEVSARLGIPVGTVKSRLRSGLDKLTQFFQEAEK